MILADSNILIYAINSASPKNKQAQKFLQDNITELVIAHQNIFEVVRVLTHKTFTSPMSTSTALAAISNIANSCTLVSPNKLSFHLALEIIKKYNLSGNRIFDAYLAATSISNGINVIATDNIKDFKTIKEIKILNPFK